MIAVLNRELMDETKIYSNTAAHMVLHLPTNINTLEQGE